MDYNLELELSINKNYLETNTLPSYIHVDSFELDVPTQVKNSLASSVGKKNIFKKDVIDG